MPRIILKPKSPEYADAKPKQAQKKCEMPGCAAHGEHKAPRHRGLNEYYHFCMDHVREYNNAWNFFDGMSPADVENHINQSLYGDRPTWQYAGKGAAEDALHRATWKSYYFSDKEPEQPKTHTFKSEANTPEFQALAIMGLSPPVNLDTIKTRYKTLAKKYHPDVNRNDPGAEEHLKRINMAYTILKLAFEEYKKLPEHKF